jgi:uncharacterized protein (DUF983 family)
MERRSFLTGLKRGVARRCPNCGRGRLFGGYLKVKSCDACGHDNRQYPSDDAPPYFTILIVGHVFVAPLLVMSFIWTWPVQYVVATTLPALAAITLGLLPLVKGAVVGAHWATGTRRSA